MNQQSNNQYNSETGELIGASAVTVSQPRAVAKPNLANSRPLESVAGKQIRFINLRDHDDMNGQQVAIVKVTPASGEFGDFIKILCFPVNAGEVAGSPVVVMTGAENVVDRANTIAGDCSLDSPVIATFEKVGDAWLLN